MEKKILGIPKAYLGAVAGDVDSDGTVSGNTFTSESLGALDGISYAGKAEGMSYEAFMARDGIPAEFSSFAVTLSTASAI